MGGPHRKGAKMRARNNNKQSLTCTHTASPTVACRGTTRHVPLSLTCVSLTPKKEKNSPDHKSLPQPSRSSPVLRMKHAANQKTRLAGQQYLCSSCSGLCIELGIQPPAFLDTPHSSHRQGLNSALCAFCETAEERKSLLYRF